MRNELGHRPPKGTRAMNSSKRAGSPWRGRRVVALAAVLALAPAACSSDRQDLVSTVGDVILRFNISTDLTGGNPAGTFAAKAGAAGTADTITLTVRNLAALNGVYQVWLLNAATGQVASPVGEWVATEPDANGDPVQVGSGQGRSFNAGSKRTITFTTNSALAGMDLGQTTHVFLSIESAEASAPSTAQPLWGRHTGADGTPASGNLSFGTFDLGDEPVTFGGSPFGEGAFTGAEFGRTDLLRVRFRNLPLPPIGYFYEGYLRTDDGATETSTGELTTEFAEGFRSLRDVDVDRSISSQIAPTRIIEAAIRATLADVGGTEFYVFDEFVLKLRPKISTESGPTVVVGGTVPDGVKARGASED